MSSSRPAQSGGIGFTSALLLIFITLKLCNVIHWSWLWVLSPFWIPLAAEVTLLIVYAILCVIDKRAKKP